MHKNAVRVARPKAVRRNRPKSCPPVNDSPPPSALGKRRGYLESCLALVLLILSAPVIVLASLLIKLTSRGPILYSQTRLGRAGSLYVLYKLRTMHHQCEGKTGVVWSIPGDPRVTAVGRLLRRTHIDELPQLWNVFRGEMGLVGPRPERPEFLPLLEQAVPLYRKRLLVRPGITGLAQVQLYADIDVASVRSKLTYDLYYIRHRSVLLDARILFATMLRLLGLGFSTIRNLAHLPSVGVVEEEYRRSLTEHGGVPGANAVAPRRQRADSKAK
jgi:lipopolysaccharide/colanic/teichoic acid biosynthesis glycosyltransferase